MSRTGPSRSPAIADGAGPCLADGAAIDGRISFSSAPSACWRSSTRACSSRLSGTTSSTASCAVASPTRLTAQGNFLRLLNVDALIASHSIFQSAVIALVHTCYAYKASSTSPDGADAAQVWLMGKGSRLRWIAPLLILVLAVIQSIFGVLSMVSMMRLKSFFAFHADSVRRQSGPR